MKLRTYRLWLQLATLICILFDTPPNYCMMSTNISQSNEQIKPFQAKISIQTKNLDLATSKFDQDSIANPNELASEPEIFTENNLTNSNSKLSSNLNRPRFNRQLSNFWSMLMPGGNPSDNHENTNDNTGENLDDNGTESEQASDEVPAAVAPSASSSNLDSSISANPIIQIHPNNKSSNITDNKFISGTLSRINNGTSIAALNDLMTDLMESNNNNNPDNSTSINHRFSGNESDSINSRSINNNSTDQAGFDRWLKRIQFKETPRTSRNNSSMLQQATPKPDLVRVAEALIDLRSRRQQQLQNDIDPFNNGIKGVSLAPPKMFQMMRIPSNQQAQTHLSPSSKTNQNKQHQLIHGIKYPLAQASTISVSAQEGASNTSLAFNPAGNNNLNPSTSSHQDLNTTTSTTTVKPFQNHLDVGLEKISQENNSQDEILRQVTSAINYEEQQQQLLSNQKRSKDQVSNVANNHRKNNDEPTTLNSDMDSESPNTIAKLFKSSSLNQPEVENPSTTTTTPTSSTPTATSNKPTNSEDVDKMVTLLADKIKSLQLQQQQQHQQIGNAVNSDNSSPSWLRKPFMGLSTSSYSNATSADAISKLLDELPKSGSNEQDSKITSLLEKLLDNKENKKDELLENNSPAGWMPVARPQPGTGAVSPANLVKNRVNFPSTSNPNTKHLSSSTIAQSSNNWMTSKQEERIHMNNLAELMANHDEKISPALAASLLAAGEINEDVSQLINDDNSGSPVHMHKQRHPNVKHTQYRQTAKNPQQHILVPDNRKSVQLNRRPAPEKSEQHDDSAQNNDDSSSEDEDKQLDEVTIRPNRLVQQQLIPINKQQPAQNSVKQQVTHSGPIDDFRLNRQAQQLPRAQAILPPSMTMNGLPRPLTPPLISPGMTYAPHNNPPMMSSPFMTPSNSISMLNGSGGGGVGAPNNMLPPPGHMITTYTQPGGPPIRVRGMSFYRPLGFRSHHAIAYQASPTISALFPSITNPHHHSRPSLLRSISPFRSKFAPYLQSSTPFADRFRATSATGSSPSMSLTIPHYHHPPLYHHNNPFSQQQHHPFMGSNGPFANYLGFNAIQPQTVGPLTRSTLKRRSHSKPKLILNDEDDDDGFKCVKFSQDV